MTLCLKGKSSPFWSALPEFRGRSWQPGAAMVEGGDWAAGRVIEPACPQPPSASKRTVFLQLRKRVVRATSCRFAAFRIPVAFFRVRPKAAETGCWEVLSGHDRLQIRQQTMLGTNGLMEVRAQAVVSRVVPRSHTFGVAPRSAASSLARSFSRSARPNAPAGKNAGQSAPSQALQVRTRTRCATWSRSAERRDGSALAASTRLNSA